MKEILKDWGKELWIAEEAEYGGKILIVKENKGTSQHYHDTVKLSYPDLFCRDESKGS